MPELPVVGDAPSKAASGAGGLVTKRIGPLPLWAWAGAVGLAVLAMGVVSRKGKFAVTGAGVATTAAPVRQSAMSPGDASGVGSITAPAHPTPDPTIIDPIVRIPEWNMPDHGRVGPIIGGGELIPIGGPHTPATTSPIPVPHSGVGATPGGSSFTGGVTVPIPWTAPPTATDIPAWQFPGGVPRSFPDTEISPPAARPTNGRTGGEPLVGYVPQPGNSDNPNIDRRG